MRGPAIHLLLLGLTLAACDGSSPGRQATPPGEASASVTPRPATARVPAVPRSADTAANTAADATANTAADTRPADAGSPAHAAAGDAGRGLPPNPVAARTLSTPLGPCTLQLTIDGARMRWHAHRTDPAGSAVCEVLDPAHKPGWIALAEQAWQTGAPADELLLTVDFRGDARGVETWFRYQAGNAELQKAARGRRGDAHARLLGEHMLRSGALSRFGDLLETMGLSLHSVSLEKVEVLGVRRWGRELPVSKAWKLPRSSRLALPYLTALKLRPR